MSEDAWCEICATSSKRLQPWIDGLAQCIESQRGEDPIFAGERNGVGDSRNRDDFHKRHQQLVLKVSVEAALHQSLRHFEGNARSAELLVRILASASDSD